MVDRLDAPDVPRCGERGIVTAAVRAPTGATSNPNTSSEFFRDMVRQNRRIEKCFMRAVAKTTTTFAPTVNTVAGGHERTTLTATTKATNEGLTVSHQGVKLALRTSGMLRASLVMRV